MKKIKELLLSLTLGVIFSLMACAPTPISEELVTSLDPSPSTTTTSTQQLTIAQNTPAPFPQALCRGVSTAEIELRLFLPYAAAAELDPIAVGNIPLNINTEQESYTVQGNGHLSYDEIQTWTFEDGKETAEVFLELDINLDGECKGDESEASIFLTLVAIHQEEQGATTCGYPPGTCKHSPVMGPHEQSFTLEIPLVDGATVQREDWTSWTFIIHLHDS